MKILKPTMGILISFLIFVPAMADQCNTEFQKAISEYKKSCSGTLKCQAIHPQGYYVPTDYPYTVSASFSIKDKILSMQCIATKCPENTYSFGSAEQTLNVCPNSGYQSNIYHNRKL